jgi:archaellum component FlaC
MSAENKTTERLFQATRQALNTASFRANQYKQVVQKKIDLGAIHKKIEQLQSELGKRVGDLHQIGKQEISVDKEAAHLLENLHSLKQAAALLEEEIELIRTELPAITEQPSTKNTTDTEHLRKQD